METKSNSWILYVGLGLLALGLLKPDFIKNLHIGNPSAVESVEAEDIAEPSAKMKKLVRSLKGVVSDSTDASEIGQFYADFGIVLASLEDEQVPSKAAFDKTYENAGLIMFTRLGLHDKYEDLAEKIDAILATSLGLENTGFEKDKAIEVLNAISWGIKQ